MAGETPCFLFCLPCSWGALYFRAAWRAFVAFYRLRAYPPFYNVSVEAFQKGEGTSREVRGSVCPIMGNRSIAALAAQAAHRVRTSHSPRYAHTLPAAQCASVRAAHVSTSDLAEPGPRRSGSCH